jgi:ABC-type multidrug transport system fused ATPase/permease subunit
VKLLLGLLSPTLGSISIGGVVPREYIARGLGKVAYVPQEPTSIDGTIRDNIVFESPKNFWSDDLIWRVLDIVALSTYVSNLELKLDTPIGPAGVILSGGQLQRINIARALLGNPDILILDEPTSALDSESERAIKSLLLKLHQKSTVIMIAHRLSTLENVDTILKVDNGEVTIT